MRQIQFESDNSSQSATESPSLLVLEPGHVPVDSSIPKPTFSRPREQAQPGNDSVIEIVYEWMPEENAAKTPPIVDGSSPTLSQEANSATQEFTPKLFQSADCYSQDILNLTPMVESQNLVGSESSSANQTPKIVDCLETQDLLRNRWVAEKKSTIIHNKKKIMKKIKLTKITKNETTVGREETIAIRQTSTVDFSLEVQRQFDRFPGKFNRVFTLNHSLRQKSLF
jgi:hypothetical protein